MVKGLAHPADSGHFDELQGKCSPVCVQPVQPMAEPETTPAPEAEPDLSPAWQTFFDQLGSTGLDDLDRRTQTLARQVRDNGITYNVYASQGGPQRPWALDLFPLIITPDSWQQIEVGVKQRARLLERMMADVYGPQQLIREAMIPPALVQGHPGYLRAMHGVAPVGGTHLHIAAFDLARGPDGNWAVVSQRTQAPSGLGYLLENRLLISRQFPQAFEAMSIQRLAATYRVWVESLKAHSPEGANAHVALLTPGPYNETYFEHAYLARYLGLTLVEGHDLTVRDERVYLRTLRGLEPVHVLLKRLDDEFLDPLELRADSTLGIPGLLQAVRAGNVVVANAPGSAFLESPALLGFMPALSEQLLGEELQLPALDSWWCGERAALASVLPQLEHMAIKPTYSGSATHGTFDAVLGRTLTQAQRDEWVGRITRQPDRYTLQAYTPLSQMPTWKNANEGVVQRSVMLRVFALRNGIGDGADSWRVLPGGLARIAAPNAPIASMQRGGSSADVWVQTHADIDRSSLLPKYTAASGFKHRERMVTSRAAENLYWLGRYTERSENMVRLVRLCIEALNGEDPASRSLWAWLQLLTQRQGLVPAGVPSAHAAAGEDKANSTPSMGARRRVFERTLIACLDQDEHSTSVGYNLRALQQAASSLRERLSPEHWNAIVHCVDQFSADCARAGSPREFSAVQAMQALDAASSALAAITGAQTDRMTRDDGWQLLSIGRHVERLGFLSAALDLAVEVGAFEGAADEAHSADENSSHFAALLSLFDSTITFQAQYQQSRELAPLIELLVQDNDNPRSLAWVARALRGRLSKLAKTPMGEPDALARLVPTLKNTDLEQLCASNDAGHHPNLRACLTECMQAAWQVSDAITAHYFSHTDDADSVGA
nr:circularly permuted type 2 ATP-grasp protein [uncultured Limnohabitans sp.]